MKEEEKRSSQEESSEYREGAQFPPGIKWTRQRKSVYKVLEEADGPLSAVQIYHLAEADAQGAEYAVSTI